MDAEVVGGWSSGLATSATKHRGLLGLGALLLGVFLVLQAVALMARLNRSEQPLIATLQTFAVVVGLASAALLFGLWIMSVYLRGVDRLRHLHPESRVFLGVRLPSTDFNAFTVADSAASSKRKRRAFFGLVVTPSRLLIYELKPTVDRMAEVPKALISSSTAGQVTSLNRPGPAITLRYSDRSIKECSFGVASPRWPYFFLIGEGGLSAIAQDLISPSEL